MSTCDPSTAPRPIVRSATRSTPARRCLVGAATLACVLASFVAPASSAPDPVATAESRLASATADRVAAEEKVVHVRARLEAANERLAELGRANEQLTEEIAQARRELREFAIAAYIDGGQAAIFRSSLDPEQAQALSWQASLSLQQSSSAGQAAERFAELKESNEPEKIEAAEALDRLQVELQAAEYDQIQAAAFERDAESALAAARAARQAAQEREAQQRAAAASAARSSGGSSPSAGATAGGSVAAAPAGSGGALGNPTAAESATLAKIRRCESRGNYSIVSSTGRYRGAYQFDHTTWRGMGGSGDPAAASPQEQDYRALLLLRLRGTRPWPHCGR